MSVQVRAAALQDGVAVLELLEKVGYYPEPISFAQTYRKTLANPHFLVRVAENAGRIVGLASLSLRYQLGLGGLLAALDELVILAGLTVAEHKRANRLLLRRRSARRAEWAPAAWYCARTRAPHRHAPRSCARPRKPPPSRRTPPPEPAWRGRWDNRRPWPRASR
jgi:hypothetical protein